jgi:diguanylate cyclase (GGDEF)-like protein
VPRDPCRLLVVDDNSENRDLLLDRLAHSGYQVETADTGADALDKINHAHYDLVLLDQLMPGMTGLDLLRLLRATYSPSQLPVIMLSAVDNSAAIVDALGQGANDYVVRPLDLPVMDARIQTQLSRSQAERQDRQMDPLTGLGNRAMFLVQLGDALAQQHPEKSLAVLLLDLDGFQILNDNLGHQAGDHALIEAVARFRQVITDSAMHPAPLMARVGADEFALLLDGAPVEQAEALARTLLACLSRPFLLDGSRVSVSACAGIAFRSSPETRATELLRDARVTMFEARREGRNRWESFDPQLRHRAHIRMAMAIDLHQAIERNQMELFYQPIVSLQSRCAVGFEALLRWRHPQYGLIQPLDFIPIAEDTGLIIPLGNWVIQQAAAQLKIWQTVFPLTPALAMNVNVSVKQLAGPQLAQFVARVLDETGIPPESFNLEITESALIPELDSVQNILSGLRALHVGLKLDDFGTGYSSLSCLRTLHFDALKIDRSFVQRLNLDAESCAIVETILSLAGSLHMTVVAEGIQTEEQRATLLRLGCETGQGFLFSKPVAADAAERALASEISAAKLALA